MLVYILKSTFCLVLLLGIYHLFLEKEKMHTFNRFYLLGSILFSFLVPSFIITVAPAITETPLPTNTINQLPLNLTPQRVVNSINYTQYMIGLYLLISIAFFVLLSKKMYNLLNKVKRNQQLNYFSATVVLLKERIVPYTFLHYIFVNKFSYQTNGLEQQILTHELAHVEQKHSIDVLFIEVLQNLFWFNPIFRYYKKAIQLNHEFLADDAVLQSHKNITEYQYLLLNTTAQKNNIYLASNLNYSLTKKRLLMMTTSSSRIKILLKKLMVFPLIAGFTFAFAQRIEAKQKKKKIPQVVEVKLDKNGISKEAMKEYQILFNKGKKIKHVNIYKHKDVHKMIALYKSMSIKQRKSVTDIRKVLPEPPPKMNKKIIHTGKLAKKPQVREVKPIKIKVIKEKKKSKIKLEPKEVKELVEIKETKELKEVIEVQEVKNEIQEIEVINERPVLIKEVIDTPEVVEIIEDVKEQEIVTIDKVNDLTNDEIIDLSPNQKTDLKKVYYINNKIITEKKFKRLKLSKIKKLRIKKDKDNTNHIYITLKK